MSDSTPLTINETIDALTNILAMLPAYMIKVNAQMVACLEQMHLAAKGIQECCAAIEARVNRLERGFE